MKFKIGDGECQDCLEVRLIKHGYPGMMFIELRDSDDGEWITALILSDQGVHRPLLCRGNYLSPNIPVDKEGRLKEWKALSQSQGNFICSDSEYNMDELMDHIVDNSGLPIGMSLNALVCYESQREGVEKMFGITKEKCNEI